MNGLSSGLPIGVFDSGVGGLTVAASIRDILPDERIVYFGDTARCPYGDRAPEEVLQFALEVCDFLVREPVKMLVVACNTATAIALEAIKETFSIPVVGVIQPGATAATRVSSNQRIGVIGTAVTVASGAYEQSVHACIPAAQVTSLACPRFVPMVERGETVGKVVESVVADSLRPILDSGMDTLILGCTHYPHLQSVIQQVVGKHVRLISSAEETALQVLQLLDLYQLRNQSYTAEPDLYYTTGNGVKMQEAVERWIGQNRGLSQIKTVNLSDALTIDSQTGW